MAFEILSSGAAEKSTKAGGSGAARAEKTAGGTFPGAKKEEAEIFSRRPTAGERRENALMSQKGCSLDGYYSTGALQPTLYIFKCKINSAFRGE